MDYLILKTDNNNSDWFKVVNHIIADDEFIIQNTGVIFEYAMLYPEGILYNAGTRYVKSTQVWIQAYAESTDEILDAQNQLAVKVVEVELQRTELNALENTWLIETLTPYWGTEFIIPTTSTEWESAFQTYIYDPPDISEYISISLDEYYINCMDEIASLGGSNLAYYTIFKKMVFQIEIGIIPPLS